MNMFLINIIGFFFIFIFCLVVLYLKSIDDLTERKEALLFVIFISCFCFLLICLSLPVNILVGDILHGSIFTFLSCSFV